MKQSWFWFVVCLFVCPQFVDARGYTKAQVESIAKTACKKKIWAAYKKDKWLRDYNKWKKKWKRWGYCRNVRVRIVFRKRRFRICKRRNSRGRIEFLINGKKRRVLGKLIKFGKSLKGGFKKMEAKAKRLAKKAKVRMKTIGDKVRKAFRKAMAALRRKCERLAKKFANSAEWKQKLATRIGSIAATKVNSARSLAQGKLRTKLLDALRRSRDLNVMKRTQAVKKAGLRASKSFGKTAAIAVGLAVSFTTATIAVECWPFSGARKRRCLSGAITKGIRDLSFNIIAALVQVAADLKIIEPTSHSLAAIVSAAAAAATFGIGAAAYPIAYLASSLALNGILAVTFELALRPKFNSLFNRKIRPGVSGYVSSLVSRIPTSSLKCHGPKAICKN